MVGRPTRGDALENGAPLHAFSVDRTPLQAHAQEAGIDRPMKPREMNQASSDPTGRTAGQYARATVTRLRMRTLVALGVLAVATALLGRAFGLHDPLFLASEIALLATIFVVQRYVLPLVMRHDRGATGEERVGGLLEELAARDDWHVIHDVSLGR